MVACRATLKQHAGFLVESFFDASDDDAAGEHDCYEPETQTQNWGGSASKTKP